MSQLVSYAFYKCVAFELRIFYFHDRKKVYFIMRNLYKNKIAVVIVAAVIFTAAAIAVLTPLILRNTQINEQFETAMQYVKDLNYEGAILSLTKVLEIEPNHEEARKELKNTYLDNIHAELANNRFDHAEELLAELCKTLDLTEDFFTVSITSEPTCGRDGIQTWTSLTNGQIYDKILAATNEHTWNSGMITTTATCVTEGVMTYYCTECDAEKTEIIAKEDTHTYDNGKVTREATCAEVGEKTFTCADCGDSYIEEIAKKTSHSWETKITRKATCAETGERIRICRVCGEKKTESINKLSKHTWDTGKVTKPATCSVSGIKTQTCMVCKKTQTETITATGKHTWDSGKVTKTATISAEGVKTFTCSVCKKTYNEVLPKIKLENTNLTWVDLCEYATAQDDYPNCYYKSGYVNIDGNVYDTYIDYSGSFSTFWVELNKQFSAIRFQLYSICTHPRATNQTQIKLRFTDVETQESISIEIPINELSDYHTIDISRYDKTIISYELTNLRDYTLQEIEEMKDYQVMSGGGATIYMVNAQIGS